MSCVSALSTLVLDGLFKDNLYGHQPWETVFLSPEQIIKQLLSSVVKTPSPSREKVRWAYCPLLKTEVH